MSKNAVLRKAYVLSLREGALEEYIHWHKNIWPELLAKIKDEGIAEVSLFEAAPMILSIPRLKMLMHGSGYGNLIFTSVGAQKSWDQ